MRSFSTTLASQGVCPQRCTIRNLRKAMPSASDPDLSPRTVPHPDGAIAHDRTRIIRGLRLATGLILFSFAACHLLNHAFGIRSTGAMQAASEVLLAPWQSTGGLWLLYGAFITHATLGL